MLQLLDGDGALEGLLVVFGHVRDGEFEFLHIALGHADEIALELLRHQLHAHDVSAAVGAKVVQTLACLACLDGDQRCIVLADRVRFVTLEGGEAFRQVFQLGVHRAFVESKRLDGDGDGLVRVKLVSGFGNHLQGELERVAALNGFAELSFGRIRRAQVALVHRERHQVVDGHLLANRIKILHAERFLSSRLGCLAGFDLDAHLRAERIARHVERLGNLRRRGDGIELDAAVLELLLGYLHRVIPLYSLKQSCRNAASGYCNARAPPHRAQASYSFDFRLSTMSMRRSFPRIASVTTTENSMVSKNAMTKLGAWMSRPNITWSTSAVVMT